MEFPGNMQEMLQKAQEMQSKMAELKANAESVEVEASAGGGMVVVKANGVPAISSIKIEKEVVNAEDVEMLEDLVKAACNEAIRKAKDHFTDEFKKITGGISIPGFNL